MRRRDRGMTGRAAARRKAVRFGAGVRTTVQTPNLRDRNG